MCNLCAFFKIWSSAGSGRRGPQPPPPPTAPSRSVRSSASSETIHPTTSHASSRHSGGHRSTENSARGSMTDVSISSINSAATIESLLSLEGLARTISQELYPQETLVTQLEAWLAAVNPAVYRPNRPWAPEVWTAYTEYKNLGEEQVARRRAFMQHCANTPTSGTPEQHLERARLAVEWGNAALRAGEARLQFIDTYRQAYNSTASVATHIEEGRNAIATGRRAVREARDNYQRIFLAFGRLSNPQVFQD